ncbi:Os03g0415302 [Oryza sativa Japonica Group]|jgi:hypothetical protein|uniref:Os03g0415302 protein n=1 Tax=Oryza sativa subsp. japonica TaxID=39947 RepID=A0A0P0VYM4_ORYSJ|nr:Os03g0415302 [Oryza sativa Japonica Group]
MQPHASRRGHEEAKALLATDLTDATKGKGVRRSPLGTRVPSLRTIDDAMPVDGKALLLAMEVRRKRKFILAKVSPDDGRSRGTISGRVMRE